MTLIETDNGLQGDHDSALSILDKLATGGVVSCGEEDEACEVCSDELLDSLSITPLGCL